MTTKKFSKAICAGFVFLLSGVAYANVMCTITATRQLGNGQSHSATWTIPGSNEQDALSRFNRMTKGLYQIDSHSCRPG